MKSLSENQLKKRATIIQSATELFSYNGYADTTISKIAKRSGISFGSVFTYFETKEALFETVIIEPIEEFKKLFFRMPTGSIDKTGIKEMTRKHIDFFVNQRPYLQLIQQVLGQPEKFPKLFTELTDFYEEWLQILIRFIQESQGHRLLEQFDPEAVARGYISFLIGMRLTLTDDETNSVWKHFYAIANRILGIKESE